MTNNPTPHNTSNAGSSGRRAGKLSGRSLSLISFAAVAVLVAAAVATFLLLNDDGASDTATSEAAGNASAVVADTAAAPVPEPAVAPADDSNDDSNDESGEAGPSIDKLDVPTSFITCPGDEPSADASTDASASAPSEGTVAEPAAAPGDEAVSDEDLDTAVSSVNACDPDDPSLPSTQPAGVPPAPLPASQLSDGEHTDELRPASDSDTAVDTGIDTGTGEAVSTESADIAASFITCPGDEPSAPPTKFDDREELIAPDDEFGLADEVVLDEALELDFNTAVSSVDACDPDNPSLSSTQPVPEPLPPLPPSQLPGGEHTSELRPPSGSGSDTDSETGEAQETLTAAG